MPFVITTLAHLTETSLSYFRKYSPSITWNWSRGANNVNHGDLELGDARETGSPVRKSSLRAKHQILTCVLQAGPLPTDNAPRSTSPDHVRPHENSYVGQARDLEAGPVAVQEGYFEPMNKPTLIMTLGFFALWYMLKNGNSA
jgi:hypothetical protein